MGRYLDIAHKIMASQGGYDPAIAAIASPREAMEHLERRCPDLVDITDWQQAVTDGRDFLHRWGAQAEALGWTANDLFGLHEPPERPGPSYRRLGRYDATGLLWFLHGRPVVALTATTAVIGSIGGPAFYRRMAP